MGLAPSDELWGQDDRQTARSPCPGAVLGTVGRTAPSRQSALFEVRLTPSLSLHRVEGTLSGAVTVLLAGGG